MCSKWSLEPLQVPTAGSSETIFDSFTFYLLSQESHTCFQDFIIHLWYLFIIIISKLAVLHYILGCCYYHSQSVYVCDNIMNFRSFSEIWSRTPSLQKKSVICLIESPLKMIKNVFYFILKALFLLKIFKFLSRLFGHVEKTT